MEKSLSVVVFTTPTCSWCRKVKSYLKSNQVRYKEIDVSRNAHAMRDMVKKSGQMGVPQIWVNNKPIVGFDKVKIDKMLRLNS
jgi:glutaredoxin-like YruB-family protein